MKRKINFCFIASLIKLMTLKLEIKWKISHFENFILLKAKTKTQKTKKNAKNIRVRID